MMDNIVYDVYTDLAPDELNQVGREVFALWVGFALGFRQIGGRRVMHPTGRYASAIHYERTGVSKVAIIADADMAPEAQILETGHKAVNLLEKLQRGRTYPMGRAGGMPFVGAGPRARAIWAEARHAAFPGFATVPTGKPRNPMNTSGTGPAWTIPAMAAYSPAKILADLVKEKYGSKVTA
jgi:hypothetical protein